MTKRRGFFCLLFAAIFLFATCLPAACAGAGFDGDFSRPGSASTVTVSAADALAALGYDLSDTERAYLDSHVPVWLRYEDRISTETVTTHFVDGTLTVYAKPYTYHAKNGEDVTWTPCGVTVADITVPCIFADGAYTAVFHDLEEDLSLSAAIRYETVFRIPKAEVAALANLTYDEAVKIRDAYLSATESYEKEKAAYDEAAAAYDTYLAALAEYETARLSYESYLVALAVYREDFAAYEKYLADLEEYDRDVEAYNRYLVEMEDYNRRVAAYNEYLAKLAEYNADLAAYRDYAAALDIAGRQLSYMNLAKSLTVYACNIYLSLKGPTVKAVLENEDILTGKIVDADPYAIELAGDSTERLQTILTDYFALATDEEKYNYYALNYAEIVNNYANLFRSLDSLYRVRNVRAILIKEGKAKKYVAFLAELYAVTHLLSDEKIANFEGDGYLDETYRIQHWDSAYADRYLTPAEILEGSACPALEGAVGTPLPTGYPAPVSEPVAPTPVEDPKGTKPADCYRPLPPTPVSEPTPPAAVSKPLPPDEVPPPGAAPTPPKLTAAERTLTAALADGTLTRREVPAEDGSLTFATETKKKIFDTRTVTVVFLSAPGGEQLYRTTVDRGSTAIYNGKTIPARPEDDDGVYTFDGWAYPDGTPADLSACEEDTTVVPHFAVTPKYRVTFRTEEGEITLRVLSGTAAVYPGDTPRKAPAADTVYTFDGWILADGTPADLSAVTSDLVVTPRFSESVRTYTVTFLVNGTSVPHVFAYGEVPALPYEILPTRVGDAVRSYAGLSPAPVPVTEDATYTVLFDDEPIFPLSDGGCAHVTYEEGNLTLDASAASALPLASLYAFFSDADTLTVRFDGVSLTFSYSALVRLRESRPTVLATDTSGENFRFFTDGDDLVGTLVAEVRLFVGSSVGSHRLSCDKGEKTYVKFTSDGDFITFSAEAGTSYTYAAEYDINAVSDEFISLCTPDGTFLAGEYVSLSYTLATGYRLSSLLVTDREGNTVPYDGKGFFMPEGGVDIVATTKRITYRITFLAGGVVVKEYYVPYGTLPTPPPDPTRAPDAAYTYTFAGWSEEIVPAYADATYEAVYERIPRPTKEENTFGGTLFRFFAKIFRAVIDFFTRLFGIA